MESATSAILDAHRSAGASKRVAARPANASGKGGPRSPSSKKKNPASTPPGATSAAMRRDQCGPKAPRQRAQECALVDDLEGLARDRREEVALSHAIAGGPEHRARGGHRFGAEVDAGHVPAALGEEAHVPGAAASRHERAARRGRDATNSRKARRDLARVPGRESARRSAGPRIPGPRDRASEIREWPRPDGSAEPLYFGAPILRHLHEASPARGRRAASRSPPAPPAPRRRAPASRSRTCRLPGVDSAARVRHLRGLGGPRGEGGAAHQARHRGRSRRASHARARSGRRVRGRPGAGRDLARAPRCMPLFSKLNDTRDIVLVDQRGTGNSHPLDCDERSEHAAAVAVRGHAAGEAGGATASRSLDADPRLYVTSIAVEDLDEVRDALGYARVNLWGGSYGTRVALEYLRRHGDHVRSVVLDGVAPASDEAAALVRGRRRRGAARSSSTRARPRRAAAKSYPSLRDTIAVDEGAARPPPGARRDPGSAHRRARDHQRERERVPVGRSSARSTWPELASLLPYGVIAAAQGDFNPLLAQNLEFADDVSENLSIGMHLSVICAEDMPRITPEDLASAGRARSSGARSSTISCAPASVWPRGKVPADFYDPVRSDVPTLIFSGGIDPATPPRHGEEVAQTLPQLAPFRRAAARPRREPARLRAAAHRVVRPRRRAPTTLDGKCLERIPRPLFLLPLGASRD